MTGAEGDKMGVGETREARKSQATPAKCSREELPTKNPTFSFTVSKMETKEDIPRQTETERICCWHTYLTSNAGERASFRRRGSDPGQ